MDVLLPIAPTRRCLRRTGERHGDVFAGPSVHGAEKLMIAMEMVWKKKNIKDCLMTARWCDFLWAKRKEVLYLDYSEGDLHLGPIFFGGNLR